jgi:protein-S-isoprenylcysteine O-methyltransferase Ste14
MVFWSAPVMTVAHLVFAVATTAYILLAIQWEEADLVKLHGEYEVYRQRVPMLVPAISRVPEAEKAAVRRAG